MSNKIKKKNKPMSDVKKRKKEESARTMHAIQAVQMVSYLTLRNQGWGEKRLLKFSEEFGKILADVSNGHLSLTDIADTIYDETGLRLVDLSLKKG